VPETPAAPLESLVLRGYGCRRQPINGASSPSEAFLSVLRENLGRGSGGFFPEKLAAGSVVAHSKNRRRPAELLTMTTNAKRYEIARVERSAALLEAANVMHFELGVGSAASRTGVAVTLDNGCSHLLPSAAAPQPARRLSVAFPLPDLRALPRGRCAQ
jgi:hypothetical protein